MLTGKGKWIVELWVKIPNCDPFDLSLLVRQGVFQERTAVVMSLIFDMNVMVVV